MKIVETKKIESKDTLLGGEFVGADEIIKKMAKEGFSYKGYIPSKIASYGRITELTLIFEKDY